MRLPVVHRDRGRGDFCHFSVYHKGKRNNLADAKYLVEVSTADTCMIHLHDTWNMWVGSLYGSRLPGMRRLETSRTTSKIADSSCSLSRGRARISTVPVLELAGAQSSCSERNVATTRHGELTSATVTIVLPQRFLLVTAKLSISAQPLEVVDKIRTHPLKLRAFPVLSVSTLAVLRSMCPSPTPYGWPQLSLTQTRRPQLLSSAKPIGSLR